MQLRLGRHLDLPPPGRPCHLLEASGGDGVGDQEDRISNLPDDLLLDILNRLGSTREAARTSVLGCRWRGLWTRLPEMTFGNDVPLLSLEGLLAQVTRPALNLLSINACSDDEVCPIYFSSILRAAERLAPKHLIVNLIEIYDTVELPCLDRTTTLDLHLPEISLTPPPAGVFTALQSLSLNTWSIELGSLLPMCPSLRALSLLCWNSDVVIVHSTTLEKLNVESNSTYNEIHNIDIITPKLKEASFNIRSGKDFSMSFSAPMVVGIYWMCMYQHEVGLRNMHLDCLSYHYLAHGVHRLYLYISYEEHLPDIELSFGEAIQQLPFSKFFYLELYLETKGHAFGPLVLHLLQIRQVQTLCVELYRQRKVSCPPDCSCDQHSNWRNESIALTDLRVVTIRGLQGNDDEADFLKVLFRCATVLKSMKVYVAAGGYDKICGICEQYPHVKCDISVRKSRNI